MAIDWPVLLAALLSGALGGVHCLAMCGGLATGLSACGVPGQAGRFALLLNAGRVGGYALAGHIHPAVWLTGCGDPGLRLPCFWFARRHGILPAFGAFTGSAVVKPRAGDQVFVIAEDEVVKVA